jgi:hypothetical protein
MLRLKLMEVELVQHHEHGIVPIVLMATFVEA